MHRCGCCGDEMPEGAYLESYCPECDESNEDALSGYFIDN